MGRFRWLEMGSQGPQAGTGQPPRAGRDMDEETCLATANECLRQGRFETALQWYSRALRYAIDLEEAWVGQVQCLLGLGENAEANIWADRGLERFPNSADLLAEKAMALGRTRGAEKAMAYSDASLSVKGESVGPYPWIVRGDLLLNGDGERENAKRCFNKAIELAGRDWYTHYLIGQSYLSSGMPEEALLLFSEAASLERNCSVALCAMAQCHESMGEFARAAAACRRALAADPRCKEARGMLAALEHTGPLRRLWRRIRGRA